jgi:hypothetical protein
MFIPVAFLESGFYLPVLYKKPIKTWLQQKDIKRCLIPKLVFWFMLYCIFIISFPNLDIAIKDNLIFFVNPVITLLAIRVLGGQVLFTIMLVVIWLTAYYFISFKKNKFRFFNVLILPCILLFLQTYYFYNYGGLGNFSRNSVEKQNGVKIFYSKEDFPKIDYFDHKNFMDINWSHPRDIFIDKKQNVLYINYSNTNADSQIDKPCVLRIDLDTKETVYHSDYTTRQISAHTSTILSSSWYKNKIFELDKKNLSQIRSIPAQADIKYWETIELYHDAERDYIYVTTEVSPSILKYDYTSGKLLGSIFPKNKSKLGGGFRGLALYPKTGMIYLTGYLLDYDETFKYDLFEIEPHSFKINRTLNLNIHNFGATALEINDKTGLLYLQHGGNNKLYEIDIETFKVKRILKGAAGSLKMCIDQKRNIIYITAYYKGKVFAIDLNNGELCWAVKAGGKPQGMALDNDVLYVASRLGILKIDLEKIWNEHGRD